MTRNAVRGRRAIQPLKPVDSRLPCGEGARYTWGFAPLTAAITFPPAW
jgi:hypothetical protein